MKKLIFTLILLSLKSCINDFEIQGGKKLILIKPIASALYVAENKFEFATWNLILNRFEESNAVGELLRSWMKATLSTFTCSADDKQGILDFSSFANKYLAW